MKKKYQQGGYKSDSKDLYNPYNIITSPNITMQGVKMPIFAIDSSGNEKYMEPGKDYKFPGNFVTEFPVRKQDGGQVDNSLDWLNQGENQQVDLQQRKRAYHGRHQNKPDRSIYEPHPSFTKFQLGGKTNDQNYQDFKNKLPKNLQYEGDYDLKGFYENNPNFNVSDSKQHLTDEYKLSNHKTFSNESKYFRPYGSSNPNIDSAGYWDGTTYLPYNPSVKDTVREFLNGGQQPIPYSDSLSKANSSNPQYIDYGNMFSVDGTRGLFEKPAGTTPDWNGFGNSANLISNQKSPYNPAGVTSTGYQPIQRQQVQTQNSNYFNGSTTDSNGNNSYSIDYVRGQYQNGGPKTPTISQEDLAQINQGYSSTPGAETPDPTVPIANTFKNFNAQQAQMNILNAQQQKSTIRTADPKKGVVAKAIEIARNPMTAASYVVQGKDVPDNLKYADKNVYENATNILNPMTYIDAAKRTATLENFRNMKSIQDLPGALGSTALDVGMIYGIGNEFELGSKEVANPLGNKSVYNEEAGQRVTQGLNTPEGQAAQWKAGPLGGRKLGSEYKDFWTEHDNRLNQVWDNVPRDPIKVPTIGLKKAQLYRVPLEPTFTGNGDGGYGNSFGHVDQYGQLHPYLEGEENVTNSPEMEQRIRDVSANMKSQISNNQLKNPFISYNIEGTEGSHSVIPGFNYTNIPQQTTTNQPTPVPINPFPSGDQYQLYQQDSTQQDKTPISKPQYKESIQRTAQEQPQDTIKPIKTIGKEIQWYHTHNNEAPVFDSSISSKTYKNGGRVKMQGGGPGPAPYITHDPNDPRIQARADSAALYNNYQQLTKSLQEQGYNNYNLRDKEFNYNNILNRVNKYPNYYQGQSEGRDMHSVADFIPGIINPSLPRQLYSESIQPSGIKGYDKEMADKDLLIWDDGSWNSNGSGRMNAEHGEYKKGTKRGTDVDLRLVADYSNVNPRQDVIYQPANPNNSNNRIVNIPPPPRPKANANWKPIAHIPADGPNQLPTSIDNAQMQIVDPYQDGNYMSGAPGVYVPDEFHKSLGYPNKTSNPQTTFKNGGWLQKFQTGGIKYTNLYTNLSTVPANGDIRREPLTPEQQEQQRTQQQIEELRRRDVNTPPIGGQPNQRKVMQNVRRKMSDFVGKLPEPFGMVGSTATDFMSYPAQAAVNLATPKQYDWSSLDRGLSQMGLDVMALGIPFEKYIKEPPVYGESNVAPHDPYSSIEPIAPIQTSGNFPASSIGKARKITDMPWLTEGPQPLTKEQQILQSHGLDINKTKLLDRLPEQKLLPPPKYVTYRNFQNAKDIEDINLYKKESPFYNSNMSDEELLKNARLFNRKPDLSYGSFDESYNFLPAKNTSINPRSTSPNPMIMVLNPFGKGELFEQGYNTSHLKSDYFGDIKGVSDKVIGDYSAINPHTVYDRPNNGLLDDINDINEYWKKGQERDKEMFMRAYPNQYTDFGKGREFFPEQLMPAKRQQNKYGGIIKNNWLDKYK